MKKIMMIGIIMFLLVTTIVSSYTENFYSENGKEINSTTMKWLLYNTDFNIELGNYTFSSVIKEFVLSWREEAYLIKIKNVNNKTHKICTIMWFLRDHPEILSKFPDIQNKDSINALHIDGKNCWHSGGGNSNHNNGGGGGAAAVTDINAESSHFWQKINPNQEFNLNPNNNYISITKIEIINGNKELKNVELNIQALSRSPVGTEPSEQVYQYLRVNKKNINLENVKQIKIFFEVSQEWQIENNIEGIILMRFDDGKWKTLETKKELGEYSAIIKKFSSFAIVGIQRPIYKSISGLDIVEESQVIDIEEPSLKSEEPIKEQSKRDKLAWVIAAIVIVIGIVLIVVYNEHKTKK